MELHLILENVVSDAELGGKLPAEDLLDRPGGVDFVQQGKSRYGELLDVHPHDPHSALAVDGERNVFRGRKLYDDIGRRIGNSAKEVDVIAVIHKADIDFPLGRNGHDFLQILRSVALGETSGGPRQHHQKSGPNSGPDGLNPTSSNKSHVVAS